MADYYPLIPQPNDLISESQADILNNFGQLNTIFNNDHFTWNASPSATRGSHRMVTFPTKLTSDPALGSNDGVLFPKEDANDTSLREQLYFKNPTETLQITNRFHSANDPGWMQLPGGIIVMWAFQALDTDPVSPGVWSTTHSVNFNTITNYVYPGLPARGFPNNCFAVLAQVCAADTTPKTVSITQASTTSDKFVIRLTSLAIEGIYYIAIGN